MKCRYNYCKFGGKVDKKDAIKIGKYYYHKKCYEEKELKNQIKTTYYDIFQNNEPIQSVRKAINKYIHKDKYESKYILFVLNENIKLNSMFGLIYYLRDNKFENKYKKEKAKLIKFDAQDVETEKNSNITYNTKKRKQWGDILCQ